MLINHSIIHDGLFDGLYGIIGTTDYNRSADCCPRVVPELQSCVEIFLLAPTGGATAAGGRNVKRAS